MTTVDGGRLAERDQPSTIKNGWQLGFALPPKLTISEWADAERHIAAGTGPEPGRWRTDRAPYSREPMDVIGDPDVETCVLKMSSQVAKTEILMNVAAYFIAQDPAPQMFVLPTLELAESFSTKRFQPTIEATPTLLARIGRHNARDSSTTIREKSYPGGDIVFAGANSPSSLASRPRRVVMFDEIDKYKASIGADGDPIKQGFQRTQNFWNRKKLLASTPTIEGASAIDEWFKRSDQRFYECPCHKCGVFQSLEWEQVKWDKGDPSSARYICVHCEEVWDQRQVYLAVRHGHWKARAAFNGIAGFHIWAIYSPWVSMADLANEWEGSEGKPAEEQTFINLKLGRCYNPAKEASTTPEQLFARREDYGPDNIPDDVLLITAGVDVQANRFEVTYLGWGDDDEKWVIDHRVLFVDPTDPRSFQRLDAELLMVEFNHPSGQPLRVEAVAIDGGYLQTAVLHFTREARSAFKPYHATKGLDGWGRPIWRKSEQKFKFGAELIIVGVDDGKTMLYQELAVGPTDEDPDRNHRVHFAGHLDLGYFQQLVSEQVKVSYKAGRPERHWFKPGGRRNEALDTFVVAMAVRYSLSIDYASRRAALSPTPPANDYGNIANLFRKG